MSASLPQLSGVTTWPVASGAGAAIAALPLPKDDGGAANSPDAATETTAVATTTPAQPGAFGSNNASNNAAGNASATADRHPREGGDPATFAGDGAAAALNASNDAAADTVASTATTPTTASTATPQAFAAPRSDAGAVGGTVAALLLVVGVILLLAWFAKRMPGVAGANNPALRVVGSLALGPRERVVVVDVGGTQLLLATGAGGTRALHTLSEPLPVAAPASSPFAQLLAQQVRRSVGMKAAGMQSASTKTAGTPGSTPA